MVDSPFLVVESNCFVLLLKQLDELQVLVGFVQVAKRLKVHVANDPYEVAFHANRLGS